MSCVNKIFTRKYTTFIGSLLSARSEELWCVSIPRQVVLLVCIPMEEDTSVISALYPPPPPYVKCFTDENVGRLRSLLKENGGDLERLDVENTELQFLVPPQQPSGPSYRSFGDIWNFKDKFMTLEDAGIPQLYDGGSTGNGAGDDGEDEEIFTRERIDELKKLAKSLLLNFLELLGIFAKNPEYAKEKISQIRILLINLHHLLNSYRLHQSREILILKIEEKISQDTEEIENIEEVCRSVEEKIRTLVRDRIDSKVKATDGDVDMDEVLPEQTKEQIRELEKQAVKDILANEGNDSH
ncbi:unnamed protein product [Kuraishia capsulata CBS 1993]|uniref:Mediator of RNA polymerase II transcription subunit 7 n=1 Tax=Kuraishia capsulata CBS 1993 TaxID=1382522 RepID=W6MKF1_9ASCO|nr:uncharacterized protein KUCA_T00001119001 [Kuraishia capsulata CBS 1993]CDK25152.1 unnamed protein product [Kuraishia capsulata CBS 1993]